MSLSRNGTTGCFLRYLSCLVLLGYHRWFVGALLTRCTFQRPSHTTIIAHRRLSHTDSEASTEGRNLDNIKRIFCISDLHTDSAINMRWLVDKCESSIEDSDETMPGKGDLLIVAGDISHELDTLQQTLEILQRLECEILFVPGNHEAWLTSSCRSYLEDSIQKLEAVCEACNELGVYTDHQLVGGEFCCPVWIVPIRGWYDGSLTLGGTEDLCEGFAAWPWTDFSRCTWPQEFLLRDKEDDNARIPEGVTEYFLQCNEPGIRTVQRELTTMQGNDGVAGVMTVSHFLPNQQCLPDWKDVDSPVFLRDEWLDHGAPQISAKFAKVAGSSLLDRQLRSIVPKKVIPTTRQIHVFGHSHRPKDLEFQGIRYIHNPLGKPREREMHMVSPDVGFKLLWDTNKGEVAGERVVRYWEEKGGGKEALLKRVEQNRANTKKAMAEARKARQDLATD